jgi:outer membrane lipoprotein SlyB
MSGPAAQAGAKAGLGEVSHIAGCIGNAAVGAAPQGYLLEDVMRRRDYYRARMRHADGHYVHVVVIVDDPTSTAQETP